MTGNASLDGGSLRIIDTKLRDVKIVETRRFADARGNLFEAWNERSFRGAGIDAGFVQDNVSVSAKHVLRGMHFQVRQPQGKLVRCLAGATFTVAVDLRRASPDFGRHATFALSPAEAKALWVPAGFAHGFLALADETIVMYKCTDFYAPEHERVLAWDDRDVAIDWPLPPGQAPLLSPKDRQGLKLADIEDIVLD